MGNLFSWWLVVEVVGVVSLPMAAVLCANLPDRGWGLARPLGLLVLGWLVWFPLSIAQGLPYSRAWIAGTLLVLALGNAALLRQAKLRDTLRRFVMREWGYILAGEGVFAGALALMGWLRSFTPAVVDTEKFMDVAFLAAIWRAPHLPAPDPWLSGQPINYYYFGHFLMATLAKLLGTQPAVAFNTAVALTFALTAVAVFALATNLAAALRHGTRRSLWRNAPFGLASVLLVLVLGNLDGAVVWWKQAVTAVSQHTLTSPWGWWTQRALWTQYDWWSPSRVVPNTITEFPAFSFILADLHAHVLALPFATLGLAVALNLALARGVGLRVFGNRGTGALALLLAALVLGGLYAINGWDLPTYLGAALLALGTQQWIAHGRRWDSIFALNVISSGIMLAALAVLLYIPFYRGFVSPAQGIGLVPASARTLIGDELAMFGLPLFLVGSLLVVRLVGVAGGGARGRPLFASEDDEARRGAAPVVLVGTIVALLGLWTLNTKQSHAWVLMWSVLLVAGCAALVWRTLAGRWTSTGRPYATETGRETHDVDERENGGGGGEDVAGQAEVFLWCLVGTAAALIGVCELIYLRDVFGGGVLFRMNTVFKLYYQAWLLLGVAGGAALAGLLARVRAVASRAMAAVVVPGGSGWVPAGRRRVDVPAGTAQARNTSLAVATAYAHTQAGAAEPRPAGREAVSTAADDAVAGTTGLARSWGGGSPIRASALRWMAAGGTLVWTVVLVALVLAAAVYPVQAAAARTGIFSLPRSLDGMAYVATDPLSQGDAAAIAWLNVHVQGDPVLVEAVDAQGGDWTHFGRVSAFTGLPAVMGWLGHEWQWRVNWVDDPAHAGDLERRQADVNQIYTSTDAQTVRALLARYHVRYVYVGGEERQRYPGVNMGRFSAFLRVVYARGGVTIYETS